MRESHGDGGAEEKGKQVAAAPEKHDSIASDGEERTTKLASRLWTSAGHLLDRSLITATPEGDDQSSSSSKPRTWAHHTTSLERGETSHQQRLGSSCPDHLSKFSQDDQKSSREAEEQYGLFADTRGAALDSSMQQPTLEASTGYTGHGPGTNLTSAVELQKACDGMEVSRLLTAPPTETMDEVLRDADVILDSGQANALRAALFENPCHTTTPHWDPLLNFYPDFLETGAEDALYQHLGVFTQDEGVAIWLDQWRLVLDRYDDEVWGPLEPLRQEARREMDHERGLSKDMRALERLRQILSHLRDQGGSLQQGPV